MYLLNNWGKPAQAPVSGAFSPQNIETIQLLSRNEFMDWIKENRRDIIILCFILVVATILRLVRLGYQSEWNDEALSAVIAGGTTRQILTNQFHSLHPPGYYLLLHFWRSLLGDTDFVLRLPSALMGIASIVAMYFLGRLLFKSETGLWVAAITAVMPFHLYYSQEMRMYSQLFLLSTLAILCQTQVWRNKSNFWWLFYLLVSLVGLYTHYFFTLIVGTLGLYFILRRWLARTGPGWKGFFLTYLAMGILYSPILLWIGDQWSQSSGYWLQGVSLARFLSMPLAFTVGLFLDTTFLYVGYGVILVVWIIVLLQAGRSFKQAAPDSLSLALVLMTYWLPVLILFGASILLTPLTLSRLMIFAVPGLYLLLAWGTTMPREKVVNIVLTVLLMLIGLLGDYNWLFNPHYSKPPSREAAFLLQEQALPQEAIVHTNDSGFRLFWRYTPRLDHRLILESNDNPQVHPEVFEMMGGQIITFDDPLTETFWLVLHQDFDAEKQEELFNRFDERYTRLVYYNLGGIRMYHYRAFSDEPG